MTKKIWRTHCCAARRLASSSVLTCCVKLRKPNCIKYDTIILISTQGLCPYQKLINLTKLTPSYGHFLGGLRRRYCRRTVGFLTSASSCFVPNLLVPKLHLFYNPYPLFSLLVVISLCVCLCVCVCVCVSLCVCVSVCV
jgi:hypothetical protein